MWESLWTAGITVAVGQSVFYTIKQPTDVNYAILSHRWVGGTNREISLQDLDKPAATLYRNFLRDPNYQVRALKIKDIYS